MTPERRSGDEVVFKIEKQEGVNISNVAGDMHIHGAQQGNVTTADVTQQLDLIERLLGDLGLTPDVLAGPRKDLRDARAAVQQTEPDKGRAASKLESMTRVLSSVGAFVGAGAGLLGPLGMIVGWLGAAGHGLAELLGNK